MYSLLVFFFFFQNIFFSKNSYKIVSSFAPDQVPQYVQQTTLAGKVYFCHFVLEAHKLKIFHAQHDLILLINVKMPTIVAILTVISKMSVNNI